MWILIRVGQNIGRLIFQNQEGPEYNLFHKGAAFLGTPGAFFSFSHDGKHIAYGSAAGDGGVYVAKANSTNHRRLNPNGSYRTYRVAWSPDDNYIAFFSYYHETRSSVLYTISRHTSKMRRLVEIPNAAYGLTWADAVSYTHLTLPTILLV